MLGRRRELILIIGGLIALNALLGWLVVRCWKEYRRSIEWLSRPVAPQSAPTSASGPNRGGQPASFVDIVDRNVFSPLRGSVPAQAREEEAKAPKPPLLFGTMDLGSGRFALMSPGDQSPPISKRVLPGAEIGGYKLVSIGTSNVVIEWQDKRITLEITAPALALRVPGAIERTANVRTTTGVTPASSTGATPTIVTGSGLGASAGRTVQPGGLPDVPVGTVVGGKRKVLVQTPFGPTTQWEDTSPNGAPTPQQTGAPSKP